MDMEEQMPEFVDDTEKKTAVQVGVNNHNHR